MLNTLDTSLRDQVNTATHQNVSGCYICGRCTAGCPVAYAMTYGPHRILQMVRLGMTDKALAAPDIWLCAGCETCGTRCPNDIDIAHVMDSLRQLGRAQGVKNPAADIGGFHELFLNIVKLTGRMHEASLLVLYKLQARDLFSDIPAGMQLFIKGKVPILPDRIKGTREIQRMLK